MVRIAVCMALLLPCSCGPKRTEPPTPSGTLTEVVADAEELLAAGDPEGAMTLSDWLLQQTSLTPEDRQRVRFLRVAACLRQGAGQCDRDRLGVLLTDLASSDRVQDVLLVEAIRELLAEVDSSEETARELARLQEQLKRIDLGRPPKNP